MNNFNLKVSYVIFITVFFVSLFKICSYDIFWHIKVGEYIVNNCNIINKNFFSYTFPDYPWIPTYWLFEVIVFFIYKIAGINGLIIFKSIIAGLSFFIIAEFFSKRIKNVWILFILLIATIDLTIFRLILRPHIFTFLGFSILIILLNELSHKTIKFNIFLKFMMLFMFWSNLHSGVVFGILLLFIYIIAGEFQILFYNKLSGYRPFKNKKLFYIFIISFLATLITPSGIKLYTYIFDHTSIDTIILLEEFKKISFSEHKKQIIIIGLLALFPFFILLIEKKISLFNILLIIYSFLLIQKGIRFIPDSLFILIPNFIEAISLREYLVNINFFRNKLFFILFSIIYVFHVHFFSYKDKTSFFVSGLGINNKALPVEAALYINPLKDRIFNSFSIGGYLIWRFDGKLKVFQDGRIHAYPFSFFHEINDACIDKTLWFNLLDKYNINKVILDKSESSHFQIENLKLSPWKFIYEDEYFIVASKM